MTRFTPADINASQQGGVRPWCEQGSNVTHAVEPTADAPFDATSLSAMTSAWGPPACWVNPSPSMCPSRDVMMHPTLGLGLDKPMALLASANARPQIAEPSSGGATASKRSRALCRTRLFVQRG